MCIASISDMNSWYTTWRKMVIDREPRSRLPGNKVMAWGNYAFSAHSYTQLRQQSPRLLHTYHASSPQNPTAL